MFACGTLGFPVSFPIRPRLSLAVEGRVEGPLAASAYWRTVSVWTPGHTRGSGADRRLRGRIRRLAKMHAFDSADSSGVMHLTMEEPGHLLLQGDGVRSWFHPEARPGHMTTLWEREASMSGFLGWIWASMA